MLKMCCAKLTSFCFTIAVTSNANRSCIKNINHGRNKFLLFSKYLVIQRLNKSI